jgi:hypothetical protein
MSNTTQADFFLPPALVAAALDELLQQCHDQIDRLGRQQQQGDPTVKEETRFWLSQYRALTKASYYWQQGVRPAVSERGAWLIPSASRPGAVVHEVTRHGGIWVCGPTCEAKSFHWHTALLAGIERARELADLHDDGDVEEDAYDAYEPEAGGDADPFLPDAGATLGRRLAEARKRYLQAA